MLTTDGRRLPIEKILFKDKSVLAGSDADWGKHIVKKNVISAVPLNNWVLVFCKCDSPRAMDFISTLKKVTPMMGIKVRNTVVREGREGYVKGYIVYGNEDLYMQNIMMYMCHNHYIPCCRSMIP